MGFLASVCFFIVVMLFIFSDGLIIGLCKLLTVALVIVAIHIIGRLRHVEES